MQPCQLPCLPPPSLTGKSWRTLAHLLAGGVAARPAVEAAHLTGADGGVTPGPCPAGGAVALPAGGGEGGGLAGASAAWHSSS